MKKVSTFLLFIIFTLAAFAQEKTHAQIAQLYGDAVVTVNVIKKDGSTYSGSGFIIHSDGLIATAAHVIENALAITFTFKNGVISKEATILAKTSDETIDLAVLQIPNKNLPSVILGNSDNIKAGDEITVIGNPRRLQNTITNGLISQIRKISKKVLWLQISAPISPSSSGSPVFNKQGEVIGIVMSSLKGEGNQNINFAVPSNYLLNLIDENNISFPLYQPVKTKESWPVKVKNYCKRAWIIAKQQLSKLFD